MANIEWEIRGPEIATCNCNWGCPCQFNERPSHGNCRAAVAMRIDEGHFADVKLDGLRWVGCFAWPGAIHEGHGEALPIVDARADETQREALLTILSGQESEPGATVFQVIMSTVEKVHQPVFKPIRFDADMKKRTGRFAVEGIVESHAEPIRNPVTGEPHFAKLVLETGFEYTEAEFASSKAKASGVIPLEWARGHAHLADIHMTRRGPVR